MFGMELETPETEEVWTPVTYNNSPNYVISPTYQQRIIKWEGPTMRTNNSFRSESKKALAGINSNALKYLSPEQLDSLISYSYHVPGKYAKQVKPIINQLISVRDQDSYNKVMQSIYNAMKVSSKAARGTINRVAVEQKPFIIK